MWVMGMYLCCDIPIASPLIKLTVPLIVCFIQVVPRIFDHSPVDQLNQ